MILTEQQRLIADTANNFAKTELAPNSAEWDKHSQFPKQALKEMGKLGLLGMLVPAEWDGVGADMVSYALAMSGIASGDAATSTIMGVHNSVACLPILNFANDDLKKQFLPPMARGEILGAFALSEPQAGSDASQLQTTAVETDKSFVINGCKQFITSGKNADICIVFAVTDKQAGKNGLSAFVIPTNTPGYEVANIEDKMGQRASDTAQLVFTDMEIPKSYCLGNPGEGYRIALSNLESGRIGIAAQAVGMAKAAIRAALNYAEERETFGQAIIKHQAVSFRLADMVTQLNAAEQLVLHAAELKDVGKPCLAEVAMAKLFATEVAERICSEAIQIFGGYGYLKDFPVEQIYRDVRVTTIYEGTSDIQRIVISRQLQENGVTCLDG